MVIGNSQGLALALIVKTRQALAAAARKVREKTREELVRVKQACQQSRRDYGSKGGLHQSSRVWYKEAQATGIHFMSPKHPVQKYVALQLC